MTSNRVFEYVSRVGRKMSQDCIYENNAECTCVVIIAILKRPLMLDCLLLLKQYRPTLSTYTVEFPVAVVESHEQAKEAAVREIEDLTGFKGSLKSIGELSAYDAGISNYTTRLAVIQIKSRDVSNNNVKFHPQTHLANTEEIDVSGVEVIALPVSDLSNRLSCMVKEGYVVDSRVEMYAVGLQTNADSNSPTMVY